MSRYRGPRARLVPQPRITRAAAVKALLDDPFGVLMLEEAHPALEGLAAKDRKTALREAQRERWRQREAERLPILRERLETSGPERWGEIFCERPDLETELTEVQAAEWLEWCRGHVTGSRRETLQ